MSNSVRESIGAHMGHNYVAMFGLTALPLVVGGISSYLTSDAMIQFDSFRQPPLSPPAWLFPVVWTALYLLMGAASYLLFRYVPTNGTEATMRHAALIIYGAQLAINFAWSLVFFGAEAHWAAFVLLMLMWVMIIALVILSFRMSKAAGWMLVPYLAWTTFAAYLNLMIAILN
ncbi:MAG: TspO/MBR family protein [Coriobacteriales bacterium]|nr:TspO/MBR family protein [Coriobacteriales bacterium]